MNKVKKILALALMILSLVGIALWQAFASEINFYIVSIAILVLSMLPFFISFEVKKINTREITLVATMIALAVVSRAAFYLIPQVKPIAAVVIVAGICLGAERGYVVGAFSAFVSNFIFGQGFHTPFQMVALGLVGFVAGLVFKKAKPKPWSISILGFVLAFALYGLIVDMSTIISVYGNKITLQGILSIYASGTPFSLVFGVATAVFLFAFGMPFIKKIERVNTKYNIIEK